MSSSVASSWAQTSVDLTCVPKTTHVSDFLENSVEVVSVGSKIPSRKSRNVKEVIAVIAEDELERPKIKPSSISNSYLGESDVLKLHFLF